jgi:NADH-quinone oxidoreductase subunit N
MDQMNAVLQSCGAELVLLAGVVLLTLLETIWPRRGGRAKVVLAIVAVFAAASVGPGGAGAGALAGVWATDQLTVVFTFTILVATLLALLLSVEEAAHRTVAAGEYAILVLLAALGMMIMVAGTDLLVIILGLELMAVSFYVLAGFYWFREASAEGALKYVLTGLFASALLLYGVSLVYGAAGGTGVARLAAAARGGAADPLMLCGIALIACGLAFKMGAAPFQMWMPDVLEGAPTPVAGFLAVGPKIAVLAVVTRVFASGFPTWDGLWVPLWSSLAALTILWGNLAALAQESLKRMLAYSSVAHVGYLLIAVVATPGARVDGVGSLAFYLLAYAFMNLGAFGALLWFERLRGEELTWRDLAGTGRRFPLPAALFALFLFSLAGIPPTAGFAAKFWVFLAGWRAGYTGLVLIGALGSLIGAGYYLRAIYAMYLLPAPEAADEPGSGTTPLFFFLAVAVLVAACGTLLAGLLPQSFIALAAAAG